MISVICTTIFLLCRAIIDTTDADGGEEEDSDQEEPMDVDGEPNETAAKEDVVDKSRGMIIFTSDHAKQRILMSRELQQDGTFKTVNVPFFRQVQFGDKIVNFKVMFSS